MGQRRKQQIKKETLDSLKPLVKDQESLVSAINYISKKGEDKDTKQIKENISELVSSDKKEVTIKSVEAILTNKLSHNTISTLTDTPPRTLRKRRQERKPWVKKARKCSSECKVCS